MRNERLDADQTAGVNETQFWGGDQGRRAVDSRQETVDENRFYRSDRAVDTAGGKASVTSASILSVTKVCVSWSVSAAVDDDVFGAGIDGFQRDGGCGVDRERTAHGDNEVAPSGGDCSAFDIVGAQVLTEADSGGFDEAPAAAAGRLARFGERFVVEIGF